MSIYIETQPEIYTVMELQTDLNKVSKVIHYENTKFDTVVTVCGISRVCNIKAHFNVTRNMDLVTCKKCLKILSK